MSELSRTALDVKIELWELTALIDWHLEEKHHHADKEEFADAESHRKRAYDLARIKVEAEAANREEARKLSGSEGDGDAAT